METELYRKGQDRVAEANRQALSGQVGGALTKDGIISQNGTTPITSQTLAPTQSLVLPQITPTSSVADGVIASTMASADQFQKEAERVVAERNKGQQAIQQEKETTMGKIKSAYGKIGDFLTSRSEAETQIDPFRTELANINKEIADQNVALRGETDAIMARGDVSKEGQQSLLNNVKDTYGRRLADLAIRQSAANQNVTALETALDRKLELATASIKNDIEYFKEFELANLDILSEEERQRVQDIVAEKERQMESVTKRETAIANILKEALNNGVKIPDNVVGQLQKAKSDLEAYQTLAKNGISLAKAGTGVDSLTSPQQTRLDAINTVSAQLQNYRRLVEAYTSGLGTQLTGVQAAELRTAKSALEFSIASAVGTGALQAADREVVRDLLPDPTSLSGAIGGAIRGGKKGNLASIDQAQKIFDSARGTITSGSPTDVGAQNTNVTPESLRSKYNY